MSERVTPIVLIRGLSKSYRRGGQSVPVLTDINLEVAPGEFLALMGPSGSGKSTLLNLLGALDVPSSGSLRIDGRELSRMKDDEVSAFRRERVFQLIWSRRPAMRAAPLRISPLGRSAPGLSHGAL